MSSSAAATSPEEHRRPIQLLFRSKEAVELYTLPDTSSSASSSSSNKPSQGGRQVLYHGKTNFHFLSPNGSAAFIHDASIGLIKCDLSATTPTTTTTTPFLPNSKSIQLAKCSPRGSYLLTWERPSKKEDNSNNNNNNNGNNLKVWSATTGSLLQTFSCKKATLETVQWTYDEQCLFHCVTNEIHIYSTVNNDNNNHHHHRLGKIRCQGVASFSLPTVKGFDPNVVAVATTTTTTTGAAVVTEKKKYLLTVFIPGTKGKPARVDLLRYPDRMGRESSSTVITTATTTTTAAGDDNEKNVISIPSGPGLTSKSLFNAEEVTVKWSPRADAALLLTQTAVDNTGQSYYGSTHLFLLLESDVKNPTVGGGGGGGGGGSALVVPLPKEATKDGSGTVPIVSADWIPNPSITGVVPFGVISGRMPALASLHHGITGEPTFLFGRAHRNTMDMSPHGRFIVCGGYGNLAGGMDYWDRNKGKLIPRRIIILKGGESEEETTKYVTIKEAADLSITSSSPVVGHQWSPDSRTYLVSTTSPRMNVENGVQIYRYDGSLVEESALPWDNVKYRPDKLLSAEYVPSPFPSEEDEKKEFHYYPDRPQSPPPRRFTELKGDAAIAALNKLRDVQAAAQASGKGGAKTAAAGAYVPPAARKAVGGGGGGAYVPPGARRGAAAAAGGGGGGAQVSDGSTYLSGLGGLGGGGAGARDTSQNTTTGVNGGNAIANTGGGGGGAAGVLGTGGNGGSGIVIIRMYTTALSNPTVITDGLRLWLDTNEPSTYLGSGTAINDISGFGNNYIMSGTSFSYDALNRCITLSNNNSIQGVGLLSSTFGLNVDHTVEILCRPRSANDNSIIQAMNSNNIRTINVHMMNGNNGGTVFYDSHWTSNNPNNRLNYVAASSLNQVRHYVFRTRSGQSSFMDIFENNVKKATRTSALAVTSTWGGSNNIFVGNWFGDFYMMRLYNRALTDAEVERNYGNAYKYTTLPTSISGLGLWLDASDIASITRSDDNKVSQWNDKSGNGRHFIQPDISKQPLFEATGMNGLPSLNIASEKGLYRLASQMGTLASGTTMSCFFVAEANANNWSHVVSNWFNKDGVDIGASFNRFHHSLKNNTTYQQSIYLNGGATVTNAGTTVSGGKYVGSFVYGGANVTSYYGLNGAASNFTSATTLPNTSGSATSAFLIGKPDSQNYAATRVSEIIMYPRALSIDERQMIEGYLVAKYSLTANFKTTSTLPANVVAPNAAYPNIMNSVASWIWNVANAGNTAPDGTVIFDKEVFVSQPTTCAIQFQCDNYVDLVKVNGVTVNNTSIGDWSYVSNIPLQLPAGSNLISMRAGNLGAGAAGFIYRIVRNSDNALLGVSDSNTRVYIPPVVQSEYTLTKAAIVQPTPSGGWPTTLNSVASWIWNTTNSFGNSPSGNVTFERQITVSEATACTLAFTCDDSLDIIMVNGTVINSTTIGVWNQTTTFAFSLPSGTSVLSMRGYNSGGAAGFIYRVTRNSDNAILAVSDANTRTS